MADWLGFDINTSLTPRPWGPREETMVKELIQTLVTGTLTGAKRTAGHLHNLLYSSETVQAIRAYLEPSDNSNRIIAGSHNNGHTFTTFLPEDFAGAFHVCATNAYFEDTLIMAQKVSGESSVSIGDHYSGYPLICASGDHVYTRDWGDQTAGFLFEGFSSMLSYNKIAILEIGSMVFMHLAIWGNSNATHLRLITPFSIRAAEQAMTSVIGVVSGCDNGVFTGPVEAAWEDSSQKLIFGTPGNQDLHWSANGVKGVQGMLIFSISNPAHGWTPPT